MTKAQRIAHKMGNQQRKARLLKLYYKQSPSEHGWLDRPAFIQDGKHTQPKT